MTVWLPVLCPDCNSSDIIKHGKFPEGKQRYLCQNAECLRRTFVLDREQPGRKREVKQKIVDMALNGSGVRDTARVLHVSPATVIRELKKIAATPISKSESVADDATGTSGGRNPIHFQKLILSALS